MAIFKSIFVSDEYEGLEAGEQIQMTDGSVRIFGESAFAKLEDAVAVGVSNAVVRVASGKYEYFVADADGNLSLADQVVYVNFDGGTGLSYDNGEYSRSVDMTPAAYTAAEKAEIVSALNDRNAGSGLVFTSEAPAAGSVYSTVYVGGTESFDDLGAFKGLSETVDTGNLIANDEAFVNTDKIADIADAVEVIDHEAGHLTGEAHEATSGDITDFAATWALPSSKTTASVTVNDGDIVTCGSGAKYDFLHAITIKAGGLLYGNGAGNRTPYTHVKANLTIGEAGAEKVGTFNFAYGSYGVNSLAILYNGKLIANNAVITVGDFGGTGSTNMTDTELTVKGVIALGLNSFYSHSMTRTNVTVVGGNYKNEPTYYSNSGNKLNKLTMDASNILMKYTPGTTAVSGFDNVTLTTLQNVTLKNASTITVEAGVDTVVAATTGWLSSPSVVTVDATSSLTVGNLALNAETTLALVAGDAAAASVLFSGVFSNAGTITVDMADAQSGIAYKVMDYTGDAADAPTLAGYGTVTLNNVAAGCESVITVVDGDLYVSMIQPVAEVNGVKYETLSEAYAAAQSGDTVKLLVDEIDSIKGIPAGVTLEGLSQDNKTAVTDDAPGYLYLYLNNATLKNLKFTGVNALYGCFVNEGYTATIDNCEFVQTGRYGIHFDSGAGNVVVKNSYITGSVAIGGQISNIEFTDCTFAGRSSVSGHCNINIYNKATFTGCTFTDDYTNGSSRGILMVDPGAQAEFIGCSLANPDSEYALTDVFRRDYLQLGVIKDSDGNVTQFVAQNAELVNNYLGSSELSWLGDSTVFVYDVAGKTATLEGELAGTVSLSENANLRITSGVTYAADAKINVHITDPISGNLEKILAVPDNNLPENIIGSVTVADGCSCTVIGGELYIKSDAVDIAQRTVIGDDVAIAADTAAVTGDISLKNNNVTVANNGVENLEVGSVEAKNAVISNVGDGTMNVTGDTTVAEKLEIRNETNAELAHSGKLAAKNINIYNNEADPSKAGEVDITQEIAAQGDITIENNAAVEGESGKINLGEQIHTAEGGLSINNSANNIINGGVDAESGAEAAANVAVKDNVVIVNDGHINMNVTTESDIDITNTSANTLIGEYTGASVSVTNTAEGAAHDVTLEATDGDITLVNDGTIYNVVMKTPEYRQIVISYTGATAPAAITNAEIHTDTLYLGGESLEMTGGSVNTVFMDGDTYATDGGVFTYKGGSVGEIIGAMVDDVDVTKYGSVVIDGTDDLLSAVALRNVDSLTVASGDQSFGASDAAEYYLDAAEISSGATLTWNFADADDMTYNIGVTPSSDTGLIRVTGDGTLAFAQTGEYSLGNLDVSGFTGTETVASGATITLEEATDYSAAGSVIENSGAVNFNGDNAAAAMDVVNSGVVNVKAVQSFTGDVTNNANATVNVDAAATFAGVDNDGDVNVNADVTFTALDNDGAVNVESPATVAGAIANDGQINVNAESTVSATLTSEAATAGAVNVNADAAFTGDVSGYAGTYTATAGNTAAFSGAYAADFKLNGAGEFAFADQAADFTVTSDDAATILNVGNNSVTLKGTVFGNVTGTAAVKTAEAAVTAADISAAGVTADSALTADNITATGAVVANAALTATGNVTAASVTANAEVNAGGDISADSLNANALVSANSVTAAATNIALTSGGGISVGTISDFGVISVTSNTAEFTTPYTLIDSVTGQTYAATLTFTVDGGSANELTVDGAAIRIDGRFVNAYTEDGDLKLANYLMDTSVIYVNSDWSNVEGTLVYWPGATDQRIIRGNADKTLDDAVVDVRGDADGNAEIAIVKGDARTQTYTLGGALIRSGNGVYTLVLSGDQKGGSQTAAFSAVIAKGDVVGRVAEDAETAIVLKNLTVKGNVYGGAKVVADAAATAGSAATLDGGLYSGGVVAAGSYVANAAYTAARSSLTVGGASATQVNGRVIGGAVAASGANVTAAESTVVIDAGAAKVTLRGDIYAAGAQSGSGAIDTANAVSAVTFTGDAANLNFTGRVSGGVYGQAVGSHAGESQLVFTDFDGVFKGLIQDMDTVSVTGDSELSFSRKQTLMSDTAFDFNIAGRDAANTAAMYTVNQWGWVGNSNINLSVTNNQAAAATGIYTLADGAGLVDFSGFNYTVAGSAYTLGTAYTDAAENIYIMTANGDKLVLNFTNGGDVMTVNGGTSSGNVVTPKTIVFKTDEPDFTLSDEQAAAASTVIVESGSTVSLTNGLAVADNATTVINLGSGAELVTGSSVTLIGNSAADVVINNGGHLDTTISGRNITLTNTSLNTLIGNYAAAGSVTVDNTGAVSDATFTGADVVLNNSGVGYYSGIAATGAITLNADLSDFVSSLYSFTNNAQVAALNLTVDTGADLNFGDNAAMALLSGADHSDTVFTVNGEVTALDSTLTIGGVDYKLAEYEGDVYLFKEGIPEADMSKFIVDAAVADGVKFIVHDGKKYTAGVNAFASLDEALSVYGDNAHINTETQEIVLKSDSTSTRTDKQFFFSDVDVKITADSAVTADLSSHSRVYFMGRYDVEGYAGKPESVPTFTIDENVTLVTKILMAGQAIDYPDDVDADGNATRDAGAAHVVIDGTVYMTQTYAAAYSNVEVRETGKLFKPAAGGGDAQIIRASGEINVLGDGSKMEAQYAPNWICVQNGTLNVKDAYVATGTVRLIDESAKDANFTPGRITDSKIVIDNSRFEGTNAMSLEYSGAQIILKNGSELTETGTLSNAGEISIADSTLSVARTLTNNGTMTVTGTATLSGGTFSGNLIKIADNAVLKDWDLANSDGNCIEIQGKATFQGDNALAGVSLADYGTSMTVGVGDSLVVTKARLTMGYDLNFSVTGAIADALAADKDAVALSLDWQPGFSLTGTSDAGSNFTVKNAYVKLGNTSIKNAYAKGAFNMSFTNSIVDFTNQLGLTQTTHGDANRSFTTTFDASVVNIASHLKNTDTACKMVLKNGTVLTVDLSFQNYGDFQVLSGASANLKSYTNSSHGGQGGTVTVSGAGSTFTLKTAANDQWQNSGTVTVENGGRMTVDYTTNTGKMVIGDGSSVTTTLNNNGGVNVDVDAVLNGAVTMGADATLNVGGVAALTTDVAGAKLLAGAITGTNGFKVDNVDMVLGSAQRIAGADTTDTGDDVWAQLSSADGNLVVSWARSEAELGATLNIFEDQKSSLTIGEALTATATDLADGVDAADFRKKSVGQLA